MPSLQHSNLSEVLDVEAMFLGERYPVVAGPNLLESGWRGGQFVTYVTGTSEFTVEASDGNTFAGFLLFPSENYSRLQPGSFSIGPGAAVGSPENWTAHQFRTGVGGQNVATAISGGTRAYFKFFETVALTGGGVRAGGAITYALNQALKISERGLLCNDSDVNLAAAGVVTPIVMGIVSAIPSTRNGGRLGADIRV